MWLSLAFAAEPRVELTLGGDFGRVNAPFLEGGVAIGSFTPRLSVGIAPDAAANDGLEQQLFAIGDFNRIVTEFEAGRVDLVCDYDFGAHRVARGWSGGFRVHGGLGAALERSYTFTRGRTGISVAAGGLRVSPGPDLGATIQVWNGHFGGRIGVTARGRARVGPSWTDDLSPVLHVDWTESLAVTYAF